MNKNKSMKDLIIDTAWDLFYEKGFEETTINDIISTAGIAKGSFYYYFRSKDNLLSSLSNQLDKRYRQLEPELMKIPNTFDRLMEMSVRAHSYIEKTMNYKLIANLYAMQLTKEDGGFLLDQNRYYFLLLSRTVEEGQQKHELTSEFSSSQIAKIFSLCERAVITDWCMNNGKYNLTEFTATYMPHLFQSFRA